MSESPTDVVEEFASRGPIAAFYKSAMEVKYGEEYWGGFDDDDAGSLEEKVENDFAEWVAQRDPCSRCWKAGRQDEGAFYDGDTDEVKCNHCQEVLYSIGE